MNYLNSERVQLIEDCLREEGFRFKPDGSNKLQSDIEKDKFLSDLERVIDSYIAETTFREAHDQLQKLWELCAEDDPVPVLIRRHVEILCRRAVDYVNRRFENLKTTFFVIPPPQTDFREWAKTASKEELVQVCRIVSAEGAKIIRGRSRGTGKRSSPQLVPMIMGVTRGDGTGSRFGGRPNNSAKVNLVMQLGLSWLHATEIKPKAGRSNNTGFGMMVALIFDWLGLLDEEKDENSIHALRQYWSQVHSIARAGRPSKVASGFHQK